MIERRPGSRSSKSRTTKLSESTNVATLSSGNLQAFRPPVSSPFVPRRATENRDDLRHLSSLAEIGRALGGAQELRSSLERALEKLEAGMGIVRGAVFLF